MEIIFLIFSQVNSNTVVKILGEEDPCGIFSCMQILILIMIGAGILGGFISYFFATEQTSTVTTPINDAGKSDGDNKSKVSHPLIRSIVIGIGGSFLVPLLLHLLSITNVTGNGSNKINYCNIDYLVFAGYCILGAVFARRFMTTLSDKVLRLAIEAKKEAAESKKEVEVVREEVNEKMEDNAAKNNVGASRKTEEAKTDIKHLIAPDGDGEIQEIEELRKHRVRGDQQKNQWGGKSERNGRELTGKVYDKNERDANYKIELEVSAQSGATPLSGFVTFYLHESFPKDTIVKKVKDGKAKLTVYAYGAFTVGAVCDDGKTLLELDLADLEYAPREFREN